MHTHSGIKIHLPQIGGAGGSRSPSSPARSASSCCFLLCSSRSFLRNSSCCRRALSRATCNWSCCFLSSSSRRCCSSSSLCFLRLRKQPRDGQGNGRPNWDILVRRTHGQYPPPLQATGLRAMGTCHSEDTGCPREAEQRAEARRQLAWS